MPSLIRHYAASCATCGRPATHQLYIKQGGNGVYCKACGERRLKQIQADQAVAGKARP